MAWLHPITIIGILAGVLAALTMGSLYTSRFPSEELPSATFLARLFGGEADQYEAGGVVLFVAYGGLVGGLYPWLFHGLLGLSGKWIASLPYTMLTALAFGIVLTGPWTVLRVVGLVDPPYRPVDGFDDEQADRYITMAGLHLVYGLILGFLVGLSRPFWYPIIGL
ncbi:hypothetical protein [Haloarchaeobius iranensis]|uniref:Uncharacterized protein n=1 Tax=Haloarchaeobius iranensis TaxID=996166 RepID=A0A1H0AED2_9EURY|nr:hypothetical protein [Haloarchaeobius iranensis]SDN31671.1 hypothetical protein SAMN05192554_12645 [Haloarchaeobius iranensis]